MDEQCTLEADQGCGVRGDVEKRHVSANATCATKEERQPLLDRLIAEEEEEEEEEGSCGSSEEE